VEIPADSPAQASDCAEIRNDIMEMTGATPATDAD